ncbi:MAG: glycosyltransferase family 4 protein [Microthrixaceae bacterium]
MLLHTLVRAWRGIRPADRLDVVAFRGGELETDVARAADSSTVLLDPGEAWDHASPDPARVAAVRARASRVPAADATLLVSVAAGQCLPLLEDGGPVITWAVEQGEDLHWIRGPVDVAGRTDRWLAGSRGTADELRTLLDDGAAVAVAPEFVDPPHEDPGAVAARRAELVPDGSLLVVGAGIGTWRKAPDLFVEVAMQVAEVGGRPVYHVWVGGERDPLVPRLREDVAHLGVGDRVRFLRNIPDLGSVLAAADACCHPARLDAFPLVCLHSAAAGTPVVAFSDAGGVPEMLADGFRGAPYPDVAGLAEALRSVLADGAEVAAAQRRAVQGHLAPGAARAVVDEVTQLAEDAARERRP